MCPYKIGLVDSVSRKEKRTMPHDRNFFGRTYIFVAWVFGRMEFVVVFHGRRRIVIGTTPTLDLVLAVHLDGFLFVLSNCRYTQALSAWNATEQE